MAKTKRVQEEFDCPVCGATVPGGAKSCPECGACEKSGWGGDAAYDGLDLPDEVFDDGKVVRVRFGGRAPKESSQWLWRIAALILLIALLFPLFHSCALLK